MKKALFFMVFFFTLQGVFSTPYSFPISTIIIDAGHGGEDPGAIGEGILEKDITLSIARRLQEIIEVKSNLISILTRNEDIYLSLEQRIAISNATFPGWNEEALFISIHINGSNNESANGYEFLVRENKEKVPYITKESPSWSISYFSNDALSVLHRTINQASFALGYAMHTSFKKQFPSSNDRGVKEQDVYVINNSIWPSVVVEAGFITNKEESTLMRDPTWIDAVANAIWEGIDQYRSFIFP